MANAPIPVVYNDAPEAYDPHDHHVPHHSTPVSPNSPPPQYANELPSDNRYSTYKGTFAPTETPVMMGDSESQAVVPQQPKKWTKRRVCGIPMLWLIALVALLLIGAIVGGVLGGVLGTKKKDPAPSVTVLDPPETEVGPVPADPTKTSSTSSSGTPKPTSKAPTGITTPDIESWYYIKNKVVKPENELGLEVLFHNQSAYFALDEPKGDLWEHFGFWPASMNSTRAADYRERLGIDSALYILYNRGLVQQPNATSPTATFVDDQQSWWWIEPNPNGGVYIKGGLYGPDYAYTVLESGEESDDDMWRFEPQWNRTTDKKLLDAQIWTVELAYAFLPGEKGLWDSPAA